MHCMYVHNYVSGGDAVLLQCVGSPLSNIIIIRTYTVVPFVVCLLLWPCARFCIVSLVSPPVGSLMYNYYIEHSTIIYISQPHYRSYVPAATTSVCAYAPVAFIACIYI